MPIFACFIMQRDENLRKNCIDRDCIDRDGGKELKVYIEIVLIDNLIMTAAIAQMSYFVMGERRGKIRILCAAAIGTAASVLCPFLPVSGLPIAFIKIGIGVVLSMIIFAGRRKPLLGCIVFFLMTAVSGGACILINYLIVGNFYASVIGAPILPYCASTAIVLILTLIIKIIWQRTRRKRLRCAYCYDVELEVFNESYRLVGFLDSGNSLYDSRSGMPIIVVKLSSLKGRLDERTLVLLIAGEAEKIGLRYVDTRGVGGSSRLPIVKPKKIRLYLKSKVNTNSNVMVGVSVNDFGGDADILLHPAIIY